MVKCRPTSKMDYVQGLYDTIRNLKIISLFVYSWSANHIRNTEVLSTTRNLRVCSL
jgi:hypothetical protein